MDSKNYRFMLALVFLALMTGRVCQDPTTQLSLNTIYNLSLVEDKKFTYTLKIPSEVQKSNNLYIIAYSITNDPYQEPTLSIKSEGYNHTCNKQSNSLSDICFVPSSNLNAGKVFTIEAYCEVDCQARIVAYLSDIVELDLDEKITIQTMDSPVENVFKIYVPSGAEYDEIHLLYGIISSNIQSKVNLYAKCSNTLVYPSKTNHSNIEIKSWGPRWAAVLRKNKQIVPGNSIYILLEVGPKSKVTFESRRISKGPRFIQLNQQYYDYLMSYETSRTYTIDLKELSDTIFLNNIAVQVTQYAGSPKLQVSFDQTFKKEQLIQKMKATTVARFLVTSQMMKSAQFTKTKSIYLRVTATGASYSIYPRLRYSSIPSIEPGVTEYLEISPNQIGYLLYSNYQKGSPTPKSVQLQWLSEGEGQSVINAYMCKSQTPVGCKIQKSTKPQSLDATKFKPLKIYYSVDFMEVEYNVNEDCLQVQSQYLCNLVFLFVLKNQNKEVRYAVKMGEPSQVVGLREGVSISDRVHKEEYSYYSFFLPSEESNYLQVTFYINLIDGNIKLLASCLIENPNLEDLPNSQIKQGVYSVTFKAGEILKKKFYVTVFGYQFSEYLITAVTKGVRKENPGFNPGMGGLSPPMTNQQFRDSIAQNDIQLLDGIAQTYTLPKGTDRFKFWFKTYANGKVSLITTQLVGKVKTYYTRQSNHERKQCEYNDCQFEGSPGQAFFIEVEGTPLTDRKYTIVYIQTKQCYRYPIGTPIFVSLDPKDTACLQFWIKPKTVLQVSSSLTKIQMLNKDAEIAIEFEGNTTIVMTSNSYLFQQESLIKYCNVPQDKDCRLKVKFISFSNRVELSFVLQRMDGVITVYDGTMQKMSTVISKTQGKYFRYPLNIAQNVEIFLSSETSSDYLLLAKIVSLQQSSSISSYPSFNSQNDSLVWKITNSDDLPSLMMLPINKYKLKDVVSQSNLRNTTWLVISVFGNADSPQNVVFQIQVTQNQRMLRQGQQHVGFIQPKQIVSYQIYPPPKSLLSVRSLYKQRCFTILDQQMRPIHNDDIFIEQPRTIPLQYYIKSWQNQACMFQISLQDFQNSLLQVTQGFPTRIVLQYREVTYLLYYHNENTTFRIYQFIEIGFSNIYATPLFQSNLTNGIKQKIDQIKYSQFQYKGDQINNLEIQAKQNSASYCFQCYYLIAVRGNPSVQEEIVVVKDGTPVTMKEHSVVDSYLDPGQNQTFVYYASSTSHFNLSVNVIYGKVGVTIKSYKNSPQGKIVRMQSIQKEMMLIPVTQVAQMIPENPTDSLNQNQKYKIEVQGIKKALYHLQIIKYGTVVKITQGVAQKMKMNGIVQLHYDSLVDQGLIQLNIETRKQFNMLIPYIQYSPIGENNYRVHSFIRTYSGSVVLIELNSIRGHYRITLRAPTLFQMEIIVLMPKPGVSEIWEEHSVRSNKEGVFEIYIQQGTYAVIDVYSCKGNLKLRGSNDLKTVQRGSPAKDQVQLTHQNFGGHFVVTTPANVSGQYFIRVQNKQYSSSISEEVSGISYFIKFRLLKSTDKNPYQYLDAESYSIGVYATMQRDNVTVSLNKIVSQDPSIKLKQIRYFFTIGKSFEDVKNYMICATSPDTKHLVSALLNKDADQVAKINVSKIQVISKVGNKSSAYVGAYAVATVSQNGQDFDGFIFVYEPSFMGELGTVKVISAIGLFEIIVIISLVIGGLVIVYALTVYLIKVYRGYNNTNQLVEEESHNKVDPKSQEFEVSQNKSNSQMEKKQDSEQIQLSS